MGTALSRLCRACPDSEVFICNYFNSHRATQRFNDLAEKFDYPAHLVSSFSELPEYAKSTTNITLALRTRMTNNPEQRAQILEKLEDIRDEQAFYQKYTDHGSLNSHTMFDYMISDNSALFLAQFANRLLLTDPPSQANTLGSATITQKWTQLLHELSSLDEPLAVEKLDTFADHLRNDGIPTSERVATMLSMFDRIATMNATAYALMVDKLSDIAVEKSLRLDAECSLRVMQQISKALYSSSDPDVAQLLEESYDRLDSLAPTSE